MSSQNERELPLAGRPRAARRLRLEAEPMNTQAPYRGRRFYPPSVRRVIEAACWLAALCGLVESDLWLSAHL